MSLLCEIARCPIVYAHFADPQTPHPCSGVIAAQREPSLDTYQLPEPWSGDITNAPILFLGSNPSFAPCAVDEYPCWAWSDADITDYFAKRFETTIKDGVYILNRDGLLTVTQESGSVRVTGNDSAINLTLVEHAPDGLSAVFSPDNRLVAITNADTTLRV